MFKTVFAHRSIRQHAARRPDSSTTYSPDPPGKKALSAPLITKLRRLIVTFIVMLVFGALTGGIVIIDRSAFVGTSDHGGPKGVRFAVHTVGRVIDVSVPLIFHYSSTGGPYRLKLTVIDSSGKYKAIAVDDVFFVLRDEATKKHAIHWESSLVAEEERRVSPPADAVTIRYSRASTTLIEPSLVKRDPFTAKVNGRLERVDGGFDDYEFSRSFSVHPGYIVTVYWYYLYMRDSLAT